MYRRHRMPAPTGVATMSTASMARYRPVMAWVELFLFNRGLATFSGAYENISVLFPMEQVFQDFVVDSFRRYQQNYSVSAEKPQRAIATLNDRPAFMMKPDVALLRGKRVAFILDAKWKQIDATRDYPKHLIDQDDLYQLHAYGAGYCCDAVALVYPRNKAFRAPWHYRFFDGLALLVVPFDVTQPQATVTLAVRALEVLSQKSDSDTAVRGA